MSQKIVKPNPPPAPPPPAPVPPPPPPSPVKPTDNPVVVVTPPVPPPLPTPDSSNKFPPFIVEGIKLIDNPLEPYRNVAYNFTIAALDENTYKTEQYKTPVHNLDYVVLRSAGKKENSISSKVSKADPFQPTAKIESIINEFNKKSPGRFDFFIDDLEITGTTTLSALSGASIGTNLKFTVIEPYSTGGFFEALHVASIAAGYLNYLTARFLLKIEFWGYKDDVPIEDSVPVMIHEATRYFTFGLRTIATDISEKGSRYECTAFNSGDIVFSKIYNQLPQDISAQGKTVKEVLEDYIKNLNYQKKDDEAKSKQTPLKNTTEYEIKFAQFTDNQLKIVDNNEIGESKITLNEQNSKLLRPLVSPNNANLKDMSGQNGRPSPEEYKRNPNQFRYEIPKEGGIKVQFQAGKSIQECIEAIIVDSQFGDKVIKELNEKSGKKSSSSFVNYFMVLGNQVTQAKQIDGVKKLEITKITFTIVPYEVHMSSITYFSRNSWKPETLAPYILKEYNWFYTGMNTNVISFKLNYNNLFFDAYPRAMANSDYDFTKNSGIVSSVEKKNEKLTFTGLGLEDNYLSINPARPTAPIFWNNSTDGTGGAMRTDFSSPYQALARNMHKAIIDSVVSGGPMGELEILGDPLFIPTSGNKFSDIKLKSGRKNVSKEGSLVQGYGDSYIRVNFNNPLDSPDADDRAKDGSYKFYEKYYKAPFSGLYKIKTVKTFFKNGIFTQRLDIYRMVGQELEKNENAKTNAESTPPIVDSTEENGGGGP